MNVRTPIGILSFPSVFTPKPRAQGGEPVYQINLLFDQKAQKTQEWADLKRAVAEVIDTEWGQGKSQDKAFVSRLRLPFRRCQEKSYKGYDIEGGIYIAPWTKQRPGVVDARRQEIMAPEDIWAGQLARATVSPFAYDQSGNKGVNFALNNVQIIAKGSERLDGRVPADQDFPDDQPALEEEDQPF